MSKNQNKKIDPFIEAFEQAEMNEIMEEYAEHLYQKELQRACEDGILEALLNRAEQYIKRNQSEEALPYLERAIAEHNSAEAEYLLGNYYHQNNEIEKALTLYESSASKNYLKAMEALFQLSDNISEWAGKLLMAQHSPIFYYMVYDYYKQKDLDTARWLLNGLLQIFPNTEPEALFLLGLMESNQKKQNEYFEQAESNPVLFLNNRIQNLDEEAFWIKLFLNKHILFDEGITQNADIQNPDWLFQYAYQFYYVLENREKGFELFQYLNQNYPPNENVLFQLADAYHYGYGVQEDLEQAITYYEASANMGNVESQINLMGIFAELERYKEAIFWTECLAKQGNAKGLMMLAFCYLEGMGVKQDIQRAKQYLEALASRGEKEASFLLGILYLNGDEGCKKDLVKAKEYLIQAAEQGSEEAKEILETNFDD